MKIESIVFTVAGMCFGIILGWVIGTQQAAPRVPTPAAAPAQTQASATAQQQSPPALDQGRVQALTTIITSDPNNAKALTELANVYFDAERWDDAIRYYDRALKVEPNDPNTSTDLGVSYYYTNRPDMALAQFEHSLKMDPQHTKTLLNKGIVLAFGKQDLKAAAAEWQKVVELAPESPEGRAARRALEGVAAAHANEAQKN